MSAIVSRTLKGCAGCRRCIRVCPPKAFSLTPEGLTDYLASIDFSKCRGESCRRCEQACRAGLIDVMSMIQEM